MTLIELNEFFEYEIYGCEMTFGPHGMSTDETRNFHVRLCTAVQPSSPAP